MPSRGELQERLLRAGISSEMNRIDESQIVRVGFQEEIINTALMEIATAQGLRLQRSRCTSENDGLESVLCGWAARS